MGPLPSTGPVVGHVAQAPRLSPASLPPALHPPPPGVRATASSTPARAGRSCQPLPGRLELKASRLSSVGQNPSILAPCLVSAGSPLSAGLPHCGQPGLREGQGWWVSMARPRGGEAEPPGGVGRAATWAHARATPSSGPGRGRVCFRRRWQVSVLGLSPGLSTGSPSTPTPSLRASLWECVLRGLVCMGVVRGSLGGRGLGGVCAWVWQVSLPTVWFPWFPSVSGGLLEWMGSWALPS